MPLGAGGLALSPYRDLTASPRHRGPRPSCRNNNRLMGSYMKSQKPTGAAATHHPPSTVRNFLKLPDIKGDLVPAKIIADLLPSPTHQCLLRAQALSKMRHNFLEGNCTAAPGMLVPRGWRVWLEGRRARESTPQRAENRWSNGVKQSPAPAPPFITEDAASRLQTQLAYREMHRALLEGVHLPQKSCGELSHWGACTRSGLSSRLAGAGISREGNGHAMCSTPGL